MSEPGSSRSCVLGLAAVDEDALRRVAGAMSTSLAADKSPCLPSDGHGRSVACRTARLLARASTFEEISSLLSAFESGNSTPGIDTNCAATDPRAAFVFAGQGEARVGMGRELYRESPTFRSVVDRCGEVVESVLDIPLVSALYGDDPAVLDDARLAQPALFALQCGLLAQWGDWGVSPDAVAGHSLGEYAAAFAAGMMTLEDGMELVAMRGRLTQSLALPGLMAVVFADTEWVEDMLRAQRDEVAIAAVNAPGIVVVSGSADGVSSLLESVTAQDVVAKLLNISHPFHSSRIDPILPGLEQAAAKTPLSRGRIPFASALESRMLGLDEIPDASYWRRHAREPVQFLDAMGVLEQAGCTLFVEIGPHSTLTSLGERCVPRNAALCLPSLKRGGKDLAALSETAAKLWLSGVELNLEKMAIDVGWRYVGACELASQPSEAPHRQTPAKMC